MKIRLKYVSNSSSSSFCVLGIIAPDNYESNNYYGGLVSEYTGIDNYYGNIVLGASPHSMKDNETLLEFKERVCVELNKKGIEVKVEDLRWCIDGGYDG